MLFSALIRAVFAFVRRLNEWGLDLRVAEVLAG
jgi:hypothetical protein